MNVSNLDEPAARNRRSFPSLTLRELLLVVVIASLALIYFIRPSSGLLRKSNAPFSINSPIEYRYWHQNGPNGSGTGQIGSGNEWKSAKGIEVFENFIILHLDNDVDRMVERNGLQWFDWRKKGANGQRGTAARKAPTSGH